MAGFVYITALRDFLRLRRLLAWLLFCLALILLSNLLAGLVPHMSERQAYGEFSSVLVFRVLALVAAIYSTAVIGQEVEQKTIVYLLTRPVPRWLLLTMRTLACITVVFLIAVLASVCVSIGVSGARFWDNSLLLSDLKVLLLGAAAYCSLFVLISLIMNRAMIVCLLFAFGWETAVPNMPGDLDYLSIYSYLSAIAQHPMGSNPQGPMGALTGALGMDGPSEAISIPVVLMLIAVCTTIGAVWFSNFEYLPREDAE